MNQLEHSVQDVANAKHQAMKDFLASINHEIRTPMNAIIGFSELLAEQNLTDEQAEYVGIIKQSAANLLIIINDILDFSEIEAGKFHLDVIDCSLPGFIAEIAVFMQRLARRKKLDFQIIAQTDLPAQIKTDPARLCQCLINLINNAIKFTERGCVRLKLRYQQTDDGGKLIFDVEDTGIGITSEKQEIIFDAFTQADSGIARKFGGTGLGLAITRQIIVMLGGSLTVKSEVGRGSVFTAAVNIESSVGQRMVSPKEFTQLVFGGSEIDSNLDYSARLKYEGIALK